MSIKEILKRFITEVDNIKEIHLSHDAYNQLIQDCSWLEIMNIKFFRTGVLHYCGIPVYEDDALNDDDFPLIIEKR